MNRKGEREACGSKCEIVCDFWMLSVHSFGLVEWMGQKTRKTKEGSLRE